MLRWKEKKIIFPTLSGPSLKIARKFINVINIYRIHLGFFCGRPGSFGNPKGRVNVEHVYAVTGEDTRTFEPRMKQINFNHGPGIHDGGHNHKCSQWDPRGAELGNRWWLGNCNEGQAFFCEAFDG